MAEKYEKQAAFLSLLTAITNLVLESDDIHAVLEILTRQMREMFQADDCLISMWDKEFDIPVPTIANGPRKEILEKARAHPGERTFAAEALKRGQILAIEDPIQSGLVEPNIAKDLMPGAVLILPLISGQEKLGVLLLFYNQHRSFSSDELTYADITSHQISLAIAKTYLLETARQQVNELKVLHEVALAATKSKDENSLFEQTVQIIGQYLYSNHLSILLVNDTKRTLNLQFIYHSGDIIPPPSIPLGQGISGQVALTGETIRVSDASTNPDYLMVTSNTRSEVCVPIKLRGIVLGVINAESDKFNAFTQEDENLLTTIANQLATAIDRLRSAEQQRQWAEQLHRSNELIKMLTRVAAQMEMASKPDDVMRLMGDELKSIGLNALVSLFIPGSQELVIRYASIAPEIIKTFERLANNTPMKDYRIPVEHLPAHLDLSENSHFSVLPDHTEAIAAILEGFSPATIKRVLQPAGIGGKMPLGHFPLIFQEKRLGFLWLWGEDFREQDLPTMSIFASQVAAALENARLFADVQRLAVTDGLTNVYTRRHFFDLAFEEFYRSRRYGHPMSILMLDIDHFKRVNDRYGHPAGDAVLQSTAEMCQKILRTPDIIGRYGGEEFVILLAETDLEAAENVAHRLSDAIREMVIPTKKGDVQVTISGGVAGDNVEKLNLIEMIELADQAMYAAKNAGRDCIKLLTTFLEK